MLGVGAEPVVDVDAIGANRDRHRQLDEPKLLACDRDRAVAADEGLLALRVDRDGRELRGVEGSRLRGRVAGRANLDERALFGADRLWAVASGWDGNVARARGADAHEHVAEGTRPARLPVCVRDRRWRRRRWWRRRRRIGRRVRERGRIGRFRVGGHDSRVSDAVGRRRRVDTRDVQARPAVEKERARGVCHVVHAAAGDPKLLEAAEHALVVGEARDQARRDRRRPARVVDGPVARHTRESGRAGRDTFDRLRPEAHLFDEDSGSKVFGHGRLSLCWISRGKTARVRASARERDR